LNGDNLQSVSVIKYAVWRSFAETLTVNC